MDRQLLNFFQMLEWFALPEFRGESEYALSRPNT